MRAEVELARINGEMVGARDLTWSYASFLDAARARRDVQRRLGLVTRSDTVDGRVARKRAKRKKMGDAGDGEEDGAMLAQAKKSRGSGLCEVTDPSLHDTTRLLRVM